MIIDQSVSMLLGLSSRSSFPLAVSSLQAGIYATLRASGIGPSSVVVCDPLFPFAAIAALHTGATIKFPLLENEVIPNHESWRKTLSDDVDAVVATAVFGHIPRIPRLGHAKIILDAAHVTFGELVPSELDVDVIGYSFAKGKPLSCGEGGLLVFAEKSFCQDTFRWCNFGVGENDNCMQVPGLNFRMSPALVSVLRKSYDQFANLYHRLNDSWAAIESNNSHFGSIISSIGSLGWYRPFLIPMKTLAKNMPLYVEGEGISWKRCYIRVPAVALVEHVPQDIRISAELVANRLVWYRPCFPDHWEV